MKAIPDALSMSLTVVIGIGIAFLAFQEFDRRNREARSFKRFAERTTLLDRLNYLSPKALGVQWNDGDVSQYSLEAGSRTAINVEYGIHKNLPDDAGRTWLTATNGEKVGPNPLKLWRLLAEDDPAMTSHEMAILEAPGLMTYPFRNRQKRREVIVEDQGKEPMMIDSKEIETTHAFVFVKSSDQRLRPFLEIWYAAEVSPLGIVQARWNGASIRLSTHSKSTEAAKASAISIINQAPIATTSCTRCHENQGVGVGSPSPRAITGRVLQFPEVLYHWKQAGVDIGDEIDVRLPRNSIGKVKFSSKEGSVYISPNRFGQVRVRRPLDDAPFEISAETPLAVLLETLEPKGQ